MGDPTEQRQAGGLLEARMGGTGGRQSRPQFSLLPIQAPKPAADALSKLEAWLEGGPQVELLEHETS